jgi:hypothetical protein
MTRNLFQLDQVPRIYRATKQKNREKSLFSKIEKNRFLQSTKVDRSLQRGEILGPNLSHRHKTKMHCSHLNIFSKVALFLEIGEGKVRQWFLRG